MLETQLRRKTALSSRRQLSGVPAQGSCLELLHVSEFPKLALREHAVQMGSQGSFEGGIVPACGVLTHPRRLGCLLTRMPRTVFLRDNPLLGQSLVTPFAPAIVALPLQSAAGMGGRAVFPAKLARQIPVETRRLHSRSVP